MATFTETRGIGEFLLSEANFHRSRDNVQVAPSQTVLPRSILARKPVVSAVAAVAASDAGNTPGSGTLTLAAPAVASLVKDGVYQVICLQAVADGGIFEVSDPAGISIGKATVGTAFDKEVKFTIADATDFVAGDRFTITVAADVYQFFAFDPAGTDGGEVPAAIAINGVVTPADATAWLPVIARSAEVKGQLLEWPEGISAAQQADAVQALARLKIIIRN